MVNETKTTNPPFGEVKHLLSDKPLRRPRRWPMVEELRQMAKEYPPPQSWYEGDEPKPF